MININDYINSGIIESYVLGLSSVEEQSELEVLAISHPEVRTAINDFSDALEQHALVNAIPVDPLVKPLVMATIDYMTRLQNGEMPTEPPLLSAESTVAEYSDWLNRDDLQLPANPEAVFVKLIGYSPKVTTAIVWLKEMATPEIHHDEFERFLIVEGTCVITIGNTDHNLVPGDYLSIPLHVNHKVVVTSNCYCKVILQRVAA